MFDNMAQQIDLDLNYTQIISLMKPSTEVDVTEVIRSVIGLLCGSQSILFEWSDGLDQFVVRNGFSLNCLGETVLKNYLQFYCKYGTAVKKLLELCWPQNGANGEHFAIDDQNDDQLVISNTLNVFRSSLTSILSDIFKRVIAINDLICGKTRSLLELKYLLDSDQNDNLLTTIEVLWQIYAEIRETAITHSSNLCLSFAILNSTYSRLDFSKKYIRSFVYTLFIDTIRPLINYLERILTNGEFADPHQEFLFEVIDTDFDTIKFWQNCVQLRNVSTEMPTFLAQHIDGIIIAAKSKLMMKRITEVEAKSCDKLYEKFASIVNENLSKYSFDDKENNEQQKGDKRKSKSIKICAQKYSQLELNEVEVIPKSLEIEVVDNIFDSKLNYFNIYKHHKPLYRYSCDQFELNHIDYDDIKLNDLPKPLVKPFELILSETLTKTLSNVCQTVCSDSMRLIYAEYKKYFDNICDYFLMRSSDSLYYYCIQLYKAIYGMNSSDFNAIILNEEPLDSSGDIKPFISYDKLNAKPIEFLNNVNLIYIDISWPFNTMFSLEVIGVFNKVFKLLLKLKCSKWILDQMSFSEQFKCNRLSNSLYLMRFKLQHCVNKLHNHFVFAIDASVSEAIAGFKDSVNFDQFLKKHDLFVAQIKQCIFYKQETLKNLVEKLIKLCSQLSKLWFSDHIDMSKVELMFRDSDRCAHLFDCYYSAVNENCLKQSS